MMVMSALLGWGIDAPFMARRGGDADAFATVEPLHDGRPALVITGAVAQDIALIAPWLRSGSPFLVVGPSGCGKSVMLEQCFAQLKVGPCGFAVLVEFTSATQRDLRALSVV